MKIGILGAGLTGCALARLLVDRGHLVILLEKNDRIGGLCISERSENGLLYEPYGARTFHTSDNQVKMFALRYSPFNGYQHRKGIIIEETLLPFPISRNAIALLPSASKIMQELEVRPKEIDRSNFETACISLFGPTLYAYFISNYTQRMWGIVPKQLSSHWVSKRLVLRDCDTTVLFQNEWQGLPEEGYSLWLERMIRGIPAETGVARCSTKKFDIVVSTTPIDQIAGYRYGRLDYRSLKFIYKPDEAWEDLKYGTINLPQHQKFIRKCNFKVLHRKLHSPDLIQYQEPCAADNDNIPMYPVHTENNESLFKKYLSYIVSLPNLCPAGRLGLFEYLDMDEAIRQAIQLVPFIEKYNDLLPQRRIEELMRVRKLHYDETNHSRCFTN